MRLLWLWPVLLLLSTCGGFAQRAQKGEPAVEVKAPFGLQWGEAADKVEGLLAGAKATIVTRRDTTDGRTAWDVEGLVQTGLRRTVFPFSEAALNEVELQYERPGWGEAKYLQVLAEVRGRIEKRYGQGQEIATGTVDAPTKTVLWSFPETEMELIHHLTNADGHDSPWISVHYRKK